MQPPLKLLRRPRSPDSSCALAVCYKPPTPRPSCRAQPWASAAGCPCSFKEASCVWAFMCVWHCARGSSSWACIGGAATPPSPPREGVEMMEWKEPIYRRGRKEEGKRRRGRKEEGWEAKKPLMGFWLLGKKDSKRSRVHFSVWCVQNRTFTVYKNKNFLCLFPGCNKTSFAKSRKKELDAKSD